MSTSRSDKFENSLLTEDLRPGGNCIIVSQRFVDAVGSMEGAVLLALFLRVDEEENKYRTAGEAWTNPDWFLLRYDDITKRIGLSRKRIRRLMKVILQTQVVETKRMGQPCRNWYKINRSVWLERYC